MNKVSGFLSVWEFEGQRPTLYLCTFPNVKKVHILRNIINAQHFSMLFVPQYTHTHFGQLSVLLGQNV